MNTRGLFSKSVLALGFAFLYVPILLMIAFSFNASRTVTDWSPESPSLRWYKRLIEDDQILSAAWISIQVAAMSATGAVILGTLAGLVLARFGPFKGRALLQGLTTAPLVMPEVITGLSMLLFFVAVGLNRGFVTLTLAHITFTMCFVTVVVQSRLISFDRALEEAAMDLGANEWTTFWKVTFPLILPGILAAALLAFSLSIDDFVITQFTAGQEQTFPIWVWASIRASLPPQVHVIGTMVFLGAVGLVALSTIYERWAERRDKRIAREEAARLAARHQEVPA